jgi:hypothetical protein
MWAFALIILIVVVVVYFWSCSESFRSIWAPEIYKTPILQFKQTGGIAGVSHLIEIYGDGAYFIYSRGYAKKQGKFDSFSFDKILSLMKSTLALPKDQYCQSDGNDLFNYELVVNDKDVSRTVNFGILEGECIPEEVFTGLKILERLTRP